MLSVEMEAKAVARKIKQRTQQEAQSPFDASRAALTAKRAAAADAFLFGGRSGACAVLRKTAGAESSAQGSWSSHAVWTRVRCFICTARLATEGSPSSNVLDNR